MCVRPRRARFAAASALLVVTAALLVGCGAGTEPSPSPSPTAGPSASPDSSAASISPTPSVPSDGISLRLLGFENGPLDAFSIPRHAAVTDHVDQPNAVTVVMSSP